MKNAQVRSIRLLALLAIMGLALAGCATQPAPTAANPPGFWMGLLHGFTCWFALIGELFTNYRIYAFPNTGGFYDLGFVIGASAALGGTGASAAV
jgi:hypothetical protein